MCPKLQEKDSNVQETDIVQENDFNVQEKDEKVQENGSKLQENGVKTKEKVVEIQEEASIIQFEVRKNYLHNYFNLHICPSLRRRRCRPVVPSHFQISNSCSRFTKCQ